MIYVCKPNRVTRSYLGGHRIDHLHGIEGEDGLKPEEWIASVTSAWNAGNESDAEGLSFVQDGTSLASKIAENPSYLGNYTKLPILLKLLDASERLVIQAHPTADYAQKNLNSAFGKAECWYVIAADENAHVYLGFKEGITREKWVELFEKQDSAGMLSMLHKISLKPGDVWYVDGGVPHAIGGGCLLAELQEPTDLMVVPEKVTPSGRILADERLHCGLGFEKMFEVFEYVGYSREELESKYFRHPQVLTNQCTKIIEQKLTDKFCLNEYSINGSVNIGAFGKPAVSVVLSGTGELSDIDGKYQVKAGDGLFIPACTENICVTGCLRMLIATP